jgi:hypothetical protein
MVETDQGSLAIDSHVTGWRRLVRRVRQALAPDESPADAAPVPEDEIAEWLGVGRDEVLVCRPPFPFAALLAYALLLAWPIGLVTMVLLANLSAPAAVVAFGLMLAALVWELLAPWREWRRREIRASVHGIQIKERGHWRHVSWSDLSAVSDRPAAYHRFYVSVEEMAQDRQVTVETDADPFEFRGGDRSAGRLRRAIEMAVAARQTGRALPRSGPIPEGAISLVRMTDDDQAERGLTRVLAEE